MLIPTSLSFINLVSWFKITHKFLGGYKLQKFRIPKKGGFNWTPWTPPKSATGCNIEAAAGCRNIIHCVMWPFFSAADPCETAICPNQIVCRVDALTGRPYCQALCSINNGSCPAGDKCSLVNKSCINPCPLAVEYSKFVKFTIIHFYVHLICVLPQLQWTHVLV